MGTAGSRSLSRIRRTCAETDCQVCSWSEALSSGRRLTRRGLFIFRGFFQTAEPAERRPGVKPFFNMRSAVDHSDRRAAQGRFDGSVQGFPSMEGEENGELFTVEAAEIYIFVQAMHGQENRARLQFRHGADAFTLVPLVESVAGNVQIVRILANLQQQLIHRI